MTTYANITLVGTSVMLKGNVDPQYLHRMICMRQVLRQPGTTRGVLKATVTVPR